MFDARRVYLDENCDELDLLDHFEEEYQSKDAIRCYRESCSLRRMICEAFQTKNITQLYHLRYFLNDFIEYFKEK